MTDVPLAADAAGTAGSTPTRRTVMLAGAGLAAALASGAANALDGLPAVAPPALLRIKIVTIGASSPREVAGLYAKWFDYRLRESGLVSPALAASWGAPGNAGRPFFLLSSAGYPDVFVRIVGIDPVPGFARSTTAGWNGFEFMVDSDAAMYALLQGSPFHPLNAPHPPVKAFPSVFSMDIAGSAGEMLFLTCETGDRSKSYLPAPGGRVGRSHLVWVSGPNILALRDWYSDTFGLVKTGVLQRPVPGSAAGETMPNTLLFAAERANFIQFEENPAQLAPRPHGKRQLPPGNAMASFAVADLDSLKVAFLTPPAALYGKQRAATVLDPNGNRVELIEDANTKNAESL